MQKRVLKWGVNLSVSLTIVLVVFLFRYDTKHVNKEQQVHREAPTYAERSAADTVEKASLVGAVEERIRPTRTTTNTVIGPIVQVETVDCSKLFANDAAELRKAEAFQDWNRKSVTPDAEFVKQSENCSDFRRRRGYITSSLREEESSFPIAFSLLMFKHVEQTERLLRAIYRPQNYYCIHVDQKSPEVVYEGIVAIAKCFDNVFVAPKRIDVRWGYYSVLEPDLICMEELLKYKTWKYLINLTGMEFPLKTNGDLVKILRAYNGANDVMGRLNYNIPPYIRSRWKGGLARGPTPHNISFVKGSVHVTLSRAFVEFMFHNEAALEFKEWVKHTLHPDESYINSLNYNEHLKAPGAFLGNPDTLDPKFLNRYKIWIQPGALCHGIIRNSICIFGVGDLHIFPARRELFANKFLLESQPLTYDCLEEWHFRKIRDEYAGLRYFDSTYYADTPFARNHRGV